MSGDGTFLHHVELREGNPGCPLGTPKNLGFPRVPGPDFRAWAPSHTLPSGHFWVGLETPQNMVFQAHPGPLELRIMAHAPFLHPFWAYIEAPPYPFLGPPRGAFQALPGSPFRASQGLFNNTQIGPF